MTDALSPTSRLQAELYAPVTAEAAGSKATMRIFGRIDPDGEPWGVSSADVQAAIDGLPEDVTDLEVLVQTRGGDAFEGVAIMNMIRALPISTEAVVVGLAASAGSYIVQGADKVTMMPHSQLMIHRGSVLALGQAPDMRMAADRLESLDKTMANIYTEKAGGTADEWLSAMTPETWYTADEAVAAGLADGVRALPKTPAGAKASLDLTPFAYAGREHAPAPYMPTTHCRCGHDGSDVSGDPRAEHKIECSVRTQTPADSPVAPPTTPKEADTMSETIPAWLRERYDLAEDADQAAVEAKLDSLEEQATKPDPKPAPALPAGHVAISADALEELRIAARAGQEARAQQLREDRDATITAAINAGHIAPARREHWTTKWDADPEGVRASIAELTKGEPIFPVTALPGAAGNDAVTPEQYTAEMAAEDAAFFNVPVEELTR